MGGQPTVIDESYADAKSGGRVQGGTYQGGGGNTYSNRGRDRGHYGDRSSSSSSSSYFRGYDFSGQRATGKVSPSVIGLQLEWTPPPHILMLVYVFTRMFMYLYMYVCIYTRTTSEIIPAQHKLKTRHL